MNKKDRNLSSLLTCLWVLAGGIALVIFLLAIQPHPDDIREDGVLYKGIVTKVHETVTNRMGSNPGGYYVTTRVMKGKYIVKAEEVFSVGITLYDYFSVGDDVRVFKYQDIFYLDEYGNLQPPSYGTLVCLEIICLGLVAYLYRIRKQRQQ